MTTTCLGYVGVCLRLPTHAALTSPSIAHIPRRTRDQTKHTHCDTQSREGISATTSATRHAPINGQWWAWRNLIAFVKSKLHLFRLVVDLSCKMLYRQQQQIESLQQMRGR